MPTHAGTPTATGDLNRPTSTIRRTTAGSRHGGTATASAPTALTAAGVWTYTLDNAIPTCRRSTSATPLTDSFTVTTADGTAQVVTVTINGANDAAVISGTAPER